jgi:cation/acetate symporter
MKNNMPQSIIGQTNPVAILFFVLFVLTSLGITYWAAKLTRTGKDFSIVM